MSAEDATALAELHRRRERTVLATVEEGLARIAARDPSLGAFTEVHAEAARARARELDRALARGAAAGPLWGVPFARKANLCRRDLETHCGSAALAGWRAPYTATAVARLEAAGLVLVGTTHMDEFAMGSSGENGPHRPPHNPWHAGRTAGGSSSGSAAAVAAGLVPLALGSDTGGSVRQPAAFCGVVGMRPSQGRVSRHGLVAHASSLDQVGPIARSVRDARHLLAAIAGPDPRDATTRGGTVELAAGKALALDGLRLGAPREAFAPPTAPAVAAVVREALDRLGEAGATVVELSLPTTDLALSAYYVLAAAEAASNLARFDGARYGVGSPGDGTFLGRLRAGRTAGFGPEVRRRLLFGTHVQRAEWREAWYDRAARVRRRVVRDFARAFEEVDLVVLPTAPTTAFPLGERTRDPLAMYACDRLTVPASLAGLPALSLPAGLASEGATRLPVGLQIIGPDGADGRVLDAGEAFEGLLAPLPAAEGAA